MSSETDHPRQRTVAELLAAHGADGNVSGRRRRRRADEPDEEAYDAPAGDPSDQRSAPPREPRRAAPEPDFLRVKSGLYERTPSRAVHRMPGR